MPNFIYIILPATVSQDFRFWKKRGKSKKNTWLIDVMMFIQSCALCKLKVTKAIYFFRSSKQFAEIIDVFSRYCSCPTL
jgi:hypothetical protein